jgi:hypothetical protein
MTATVMGFDAISRNIIHLPARHQLAGYTTGSPDIRWSTQQFGQHPGCIRICQDAQASDQTADVLDIERFAATNTEARGWILKADAARQNKTRHGQRNPCIYTSQSNVTPLANILGPSYRVSLWIANWSLTMAQAVKMIESAAGPWPVVGVQYATTGFYDVSVFSTAWLASGI